MCPANERRRYNVTSSLIGWVHTQNDLWSCSKPSISSFCICGIYLPINFSITSFLQLPQCQGSNSEKYWWLRWISIDPQQYRTKYEPWPYVLGCTAAQWYQYYIKMLSQCHFDVLITLLSDNLAAHSIPLPVTEIVRCRISFTFYWLIYIVNICIFNFSSQIALIEISWW